MILHQKDLPRFEDIAQCSDVASTWPALSLS
jgi:hypothetical protein